MQQTSKLDWAFPFQRTGAFPIDRSALFSSYADAVKYAAGDGSDERALGGTAYVGQIISVFDAESNTVSGYMIGADRTLKSLGSVVVGDGKSVEAEDGVFSLKDFGKRFYAYVPAQKDEDSGEVTVEAHYELTEVTGSTPWASGLEPRVVLENGELVLGWFEPNPTTIEGVNNQVSAVQTELADLKEIIGKAASDSEDASGLFAEINAVDKKFDTVYTKEETAAEISAAVAAADHLKRKIVASVADIIEYVEANSDGDQYIYMVPAETAGTQDVYDEYMVINGQVEKVGAWETDLTGYAKTEDVNDLQSQLTALSGVVSGKVDKVEGSRLMTNEEGEKLASLEKSLIQSVDEATFVVDEVGKLSLKETYATADALASLKSTLEGQVSDLESSLTTKLDSYLTKEAYEADHEEVMEALTWHTITE